MNFSCYIQLSCCLLLRYGERVYTDIHTAHLAAMKEVANCIQIRNSIKKIFIAVLLYRFKSVYNEIYNLPDVKNEWRKMMDVFFKMFAWMN